MIEVTFYGDQHLIKGFRMNGHAGSGRYGHDIVCAAASALSISTVNGLTLVAKVRPRVKADQARGFLSVKLPDRLNSGQFLQSQTLLKSFALGIRSIAQRYAKYVKVR